MKPFSSVGGMIPPVIHFAALSAPNAHHGFEPASMELMSSAERKRPVLNTGMCGSLDSQDEPVSGEFLPPYKRIRGGIYLRSSGILDQSKESLVVGMPLISEEVLVSWIDRVR
jgi:hypothetical protein